jgi:hypothetical protein
MNLYLSFPELKFKVEVECFVESLGFRPLDGSSVFSPLDLLVN